MARGLQKAQAQAKNAADNQKTPEQRAADRKLAAANSTGQVCQLCRQTFSNVAKEPMLRSHWESKHPKETDILKAFPQLKCVAVGATAAPAAGKVASAAGGAASSGADGGKGGADAKKKKAAAKGDVVVQEHVVLSQKADVAKEIGVARGTADVVTLCHGLVAEADWAARLALATSLLKPGGLLAVTDLAPPSGGSAPSSLWGAAVGAVRGAVWEGARPRSVAPHKAAVMAKLAELTSPVHTEEKAARWPSLGAPLEAAHFVYVGRTAA